MFAGNIDEEDEVEGCCGTPAKTVIACSESCIYVDALDV
jgi:hypothetical protein